MKIRKSEFPYVYMSVFVDWGWDLEKSIRLIPRLYFPWLAHKALDEFVPAAGDAYK